MTKRKGAQVDRSELVANLAGIRDEADAAIRAFASGAEADTALERFRSALASVLPPPEPSTTGGPYRVSLPRSLTEVLRSVAPELAPAFDAAVVQRRGSGAADALTLTGEQAGTLLDALDGTVRYHWASRRAAAELRSQGLA